VQVILQEGGPINLVQGYGGEDSLSGECGGCDLVVWVLISGFRGYQISGVCGGFNLREGSCGGEEFGIYIKV